jgi:class 3 adenylate cyclase/predicted ATPase
VGQRFCGHCGTALGAPAAAPAKKPKDSPIAVAETPAPDNLEGERKTVTALFADIKGSMELIEDLDPEDARAIVDPALKLMIEAVQRYGGYVAQSTGDGILALFGAPVAYEDHPQRALYAALRMQEELKRYSDRIRSGGRVPVQVRVGVNTGEVVVRNIQTADAHTEYVPVGHATSLAARMQALAPIGSIAATEQVRKLCEGYFTFKGLGPTKVKGVSAPVEVYEVTGPGELRSHFELSARRGLTRFVGRGGELEQLRRALELALGGQGQVVAVVAEAGTGKSRLFYEFKALPGTCRVLEAHSVSHGKASAWLPVLELLRGYFDIQDSDDPSMRRKKIRAALSALDPALDDTLPYLFGLLGIVGDPDPLAEMDPQIKRQRTFDALKRIVLRESLRQPMVVVFEDLHWIDDQTQALLDLLTDSIANARILLLVNYRPEYHHGWTNKSSYLQLRLDPLGGTDGAAMLAALLGESVELNPIKRLIAERTGGNPFFIEEIVRTLFDEGALVRNGIVKVMRSLSQLKLPPTVQGILAARIDRLSPAQKDLLQTLAVIGRESSLGLLKQVASHSDAQLGLTLAQLRASEFIYEQPVAADVEYVFKHALTQEVGYNSLLIDRRKVLHERAGLALESLYASRLDDHLEKLAHHYSRSDNVGKAIEYLKRAGRQAMRRSAHLAATSYLQLGLEFLPKLEEPPERDLQELQLQAALGQALLETKGDSAPEVEAVWGRVAELCERTGQTQYVLAAQGGLFRSYMVRGQYDTAQGFADRVLSLAERSKDPAELLLAHTFMGINLFWKGDLTIAHAHFERAAVLIDPSRQRGLDTEAASLGYAALPLWMMGYPDQALQRTRRALSLARERDHLSSTALALHYASICHLYRREPQTAREFAEAGLALANEHGFELWAALHNIGLGQALAQSGREPEGIEHMEKGNSAYAGTRARRAGVGQPGELAYAYGRIGQSTKALELIEEELARASAIGARSVEPELHRIKGELLLLRDPSSLSEAERCFRAAIEKARRIGAKSWELRAITGLARLLAQQGKRDEARTTLAEIYGWFTEGFDTADLKDSKALLDELTVES